MSTTTTVSDHRSALDRAEDDLLDLCRHFEGQRLEAYRCPAGVWTIGYGHTGADVAPGLRITASRAEQLLRSDLEKAGRDVDRLVKVPLLSDQRAALRSFVFNLGADKFRGSTLLKVLNSGDADKAAKEFGRWVFATVDGKPTRLPGLVARRAAEQALFQGRPWREVLAAPQAQRVEEAPQMKPLAKSTTVQAGAGGLTLAGVTMVAQQAKDASGAVRDLIDTLPPGGPGWVAAGILAAAVGVMLWRRYQDRQRAVA